MSDIHSLSLASSGIGGLRKLIELYPKKKQFMERVGLLFPDNPYAYNLIESAWRAARTMLDGKRRDDGSDRFSHEHGVATILMEKLQVRKPELIAAAFLHDLLEDFPDEWTFQRIESEFGLVVAKLVLAVTKSKQKFWQTDDRYDKQVFEQVISGGTDACILKCADRLHNMLTLYGSKQKRRNKIVQTQIYVLPIAVSINCLYKEIQAAMTEAKLKLLTEESCC